MAENPTFYEWDCTNFPETFYFKTIGDRLNISYSAAEHLALDTAIANQVSLDYAIPSLAAYISEIGHFPDGHAEIQKALSRTGDRYMDFSIQCVRCQSAFSVIAYRLDISTSEAEHYVRQFTLKRNIPLMLNACAIARNLEYIRLLANAPYDKNEWDIRYTR